MKSIGSVLPKRIKKAGIEEQINKHRVIDLFYQAAELLLGPSAQEWVRPVGVENNVLEIACLNQRSAQTLFDNRAEIVAAINGEIGKKAIFRLHITR